MTTKTETPATLPPLQKMREPFPENQISVLPKPYSRDAQKANCRECGGYHGLPAVHLDYVGHAALTDRLLEVDIAWDWEPAYRVVDPQMLAAACASGNPDIVAMVIQNSPPLVDGAGGMWIKLTVDGMTRLGYGDSGGKTGANATKERIGDALRNAGMRFGAALDLWHKGDLHDSKTEREQQPDPPSTEGNMVDQPDPPRMELFGQVRVLREKLGKTSQQIADQYASGHDGERLGEASEESLRALIQDLEAELQATTNPPPETPQEPAEGQGGAD